MVEVVPAVFLIFALPLAERACLVLHHNAFLELGIEVTAAVATVYRDQKCVKLLARVLLGLENIIGDACLKVEKCHFFLLF